MRQFDLDGIIAPDAAVRGEMIIKAGLASFPNNPMPLSLVTQLSAAAAADSRQVGRLMSQGTRGAGGCCQRRLQHDLRQSCPRRYLCCAPCTHTRQ